MDKNNEAVMITITAQEYRDLITEMVEHRKDAEHEKLLRWRAETELKELKEELHLAQKRFFDSAKGVENNG